MQFQTAFYLGFRKLNITFIQAPILGFILPHTWPQNLRNFGSDGGNETFLLSQMAWVQSVLLAYPQHP